MYKGINVGSRKSQNRQLVGTWVSSGSYGVYLAVTVTTWLLWESVYQSLFRPVRARSDNFHEIDWDVISQW